jgi:uncharacterized protein YggU (UPF0235/DUF167 family)
MTASTRIALRVSPGGSEARVVGRHGDGWKVRVTAAPEDGKANQAVIRLLASALDLPERDVTLIAGHSARTKLFELSGIGAEETERRLDVVSGRAT